MARALTSKQELFIREYLVDLNATAAAERAGYSPKTAGKIGSENLQKPEIANAIQEAMKKREQRVELKADEILRELMRIGLADIAQAFDTEGRLLPVHQMPVDVRRAIAGIEVEELFDGHGEDRVKIGHLRKVKFWDKPRGLELLGKHLKLFIERHEHTGKDGGPIETKQSAPDLSRLSDEQVHELEALLSAAADSGGSTGGEGSTPAR